jgi:hypothetical protein
MARILNVSNPPNLSEVQGNLPDENLSLNVTLEGNTFNGNEELVRTDSSGRLPAIDGSQLTGVASSNASSLTTGTLPDARLSSNVTLQGNTFNTASNLVRLDETSRLPAVDGSQLTNLPGGTGTTNLSIENITATTIDIASSSGTDITLPAATTTQAGLMSAADKVALASGGSGGSPIISSDLLIAKDYADNSSLPSSLILTAGSTSYSSSPQRRIVESGATVKTNNFTLNRAATLLIRVTSNTPLVGAQICLRRASDDSMLYWLGLQSDTNLVHYKNASTVLNVQNGGWTANKTYDIKIVIDPTHAYISSQLNSSSTPFITTDAHSITLGTDLYFSYDATGGQLLVDEMIAYKSSNKDISYTLTPSAPAPTIQTIGDGTLQSFTITHNQGTRNVGVLIYETASPYEVVQATVLNSTENTITIETVTVPTLDEYTVVVYSLSGSGGGSTAWIESNTTISTNSKTVVDSSNPLTLPLPVGTRLDIVEVQTFGQGLLTLTSPSILNTRINSNSVSQLVQTSPSNSYVKLICREPNVWVAQQSANFTFGNLLEVFDAYWRLEEPSGLRLSSRGTADLTPINSPSSTTGLEGNALSLSNNGSADSNQACLELEGSNAEFKLGVDQGFYICAAVRPSSGNLLNTIFGSYSLNGDNGNREWAITYNSTQRFTFTIYDDTLTSTNAFRQLSPSTTYPINSWYFIQAWFDADVNKTFIRVNNDPEVEMVIPSTFHIRSTSASLKIGALTTSYQYGFNGLIDSVGFSKTIPTPSQRDELFSRRTENIT